MGTGVLLCGLNGVGKSTLGRALAEKMGAHFIDNEDLYFPKTDPEYLYAASRSREEVEELLGFYLCLGERGLWGGGGLPVPVCSAGRGAQGAAAGKGAGALLSKIRCADAGGRGFAGTGRGLL